MQGHKKYHPKLMYQVHLHDLVSGDNYYRRLDRAIDFSFLYKLTSKYYGTEGQESIDPVVFFKICLVGYLNNICSDRRLIEYCSDSLAVRLFIRYDLDEKLPWHSTISRTRQMLMAATCYNLKKLLKYSRPKRITMSQVVEIPHKTTKNGSIEAFFSFFKLRTLWGLHAIKI